MQEIPDTGGGLSGFIAWLLWQVYQYFPFEGTWDWLVLIVFLAVLTQGIMVPVWFRRAKACVHDPRPPHQAALDLAAAFALLWPWLVIWLFNTTAGRTFLEGRSGDPLAVVGWLYWASLVYHVAVFFVACGLLAAADAANGDSFPVDTGAMALINSIYVLMAQLLYWYWSVASLAVFAVFSVTVPMTAAVIAWVRHVHDIDTRDANGTRSDRGAKG